MRSACERGRRSEAAITVPRYCARDVVAAEIRKMTNRLEFDKRYHPYLSPNHFSPRAQTRASTMVKDELNHGELRKMASSWIEEFRSDCQEAERWHDEAETKQENSSAKGQLRTLSLNNMSNDGKDNSNAVVRAMDRENGSSVTLPPCSGCVELKQIVATLQERVQALETAEGLTNEGEEATVPVAIPAKSAELGRYRKLVFARKETRREVDALKFESVELGTKPTVTFADETVQILESGGCPINKAFGEDKVVCNLLSFLDIPELGVAALLTKQVASLCKSDATCIDQDGGDEESVNLWKVFAEARWPEALAHLEQNGPTTVDSFDYRSFCEYQSALSTRERWDHWATVSCDGCDETRALLAGKPDNIHVIGWLVATGQIAASSVEVLAALSSYIGNNFIPSVFRSVQSIVIERHLHGDITAEMNLKPNTYNGLCILKLARFVESDSVDVLQKIYFSSLRIYTGHLREELPVLSYKSDYALLLSVLSDHIDIMGVVKAVADANAYLKERSDA